MFVQMQQQKMHGVTTQVATATAKLQLVQLLLIRIPAKTTTELK